MITITLTMKTLYIALIILGIFVLTFEFFARKIPTKRDKSIFGRSRKSFGKIIDVVGDVIPNKKSGGGKW